MTHSLIHQVAAIEKTFLSQKRPPEDDTDEIHVRTTTIGATYLLIFNFTFDFFQVE